MCRLFGADVDVVRAGLSQKSATNAITDALVSTFWGRSACSMWMARKWLGLTFGAGSRENLFVSQTSDGAARHPACPDPKTGPRSLCKNSHRNVHVTTGHHRLLGRRQSRNATPQPRAFREKTKIGLCKAFVRFRSQIPTKPHTKPITVRTAVPRASNPPDSPRASGTSTWADRPLGSLGSWGSKALAPSSDALVPSSLLCLFYFLFQIASCY